MDANGNIITVVYGTFEDDSSPGILWLNYSRLEPDGSFINCLLSMNGMADHLGGYSDFKLNIQADNSGNIHMIITFMDTMYNSTADTVYMTYSSTVFYASIPNDLTSDATVQAVEVVSSEMNWMENSIMLDKDGHVSLLWSGNIEGQTNLGSIHHTKILDNGTVEHRPDPILDGQILEGNPVMTSDGSIIFLSTSDGGGKLFLNKMDSSGHLLFNTKIGDGVAAYEQYFASSLTIDSADTVHACWKLYGGSNGIYYATINYSNESSPIVSQTLLAQPPLLPFHDLNDPSVAIDSEGFIHIVWADTQYEYDMLSDGKVCYRNTAVPQGSVSSMGYYMIVTFVIASEAGVGALVIYGKFK